MKDFGGKVAVITGGGGGIGKVRQINVVNGVRFYSLQEYARCWWGLVLTVGRRFVSESEIIAVKATAAQAEAATAA